MKFTLQGLQSDAPATISEDDPHVQKSRFIAPVAKLQRVEACHRVQSAAPATKFARLNVKPLRALAPVTTSRL